MVKASGKHKPLRIAVDFDGTLAFGSWPEINDGTRWNTLLGDWLQKRRSMGDEIILWTCRENYGGIRFPDKEYLNDAVQFCTRNRMFFQSVNRNVGEVFGEYLEGSMRYGRKVSADLYIDDRGMVFDMGGRFSRWKWKLYLWLADRKLAKMEQKDD